MRRRCAECGDNKQHHEYSEEQWSAATSICNSCLDELEFSEEDDSLNANSSHLEEEATVLLHVHADPKETTKENGWNHASPQTNGDKLKEQLEGISALRNSVQAEFTRLVSKTSKLVEADEKAEMVEIQLRREIQMLTEQLEEKELDNLLLTAERNTLLLTATCQPITPNSQKRLRSMGKARLQSAIEAWETFIKDLPDEGEESPASRVKFNEKKNQAYEYGQEVPQKVEPVVEPTISSNQDAIIQQMRLRASIKEMFTDKKNDDEHLLYKMHPANLSPLLDGKEVKRTLKLRSYPEISDDCFERPIAAGLVAELLSPVECESLIAAAQQLGLRPITTTFHPSYRSDRRVIFWDPALASILWSRVKFLFPQQLSDRWSADWEVLGFASRISISEYGEGSRYVPHQDNEYVENSKTESLLSVIVCLQTAEQGGEFNFVDPTQVHKVKLSLPMQRGELLLFPHYLWHETARVVKGTRYEMRLDVLCKEEGTEKDDDDLVDSDSESVDDAELPPLDDHDENHHDDTPEDSERDDETIDDDSVQEGVDS